MRLLVELSDVQQQHLDEMAERLQTSAEALATAALRDLLARPEADFETAAERVLEKNRELYRRLA